MGGGPRAGAIAGVALVAAAVAMTPGGAPVTAPIPAVAGRVLPAGLTAPPTTDQCRSLLRISCYQPAQIRRAYNVDRLLKHGLDGRGRTIAVVDALGAPDIIADLHHFDAAFGLPDPPSLTVIDPAGAPPAFRAHNPEMAMWAVETTLDVEWAHAMAPGARILLVVTPVPETEGLAGFPEIVNAERYVVDHHLADVISQSFGAAEQTFPSTRALTSLRSAYVAAEDRDITVLAASGDNGSTLRTLGNGCCFPMPVVSWPASDPLVTAVGGTRLTLDATGHRLGPDTVWNDGGGGAGGGGTSTVFERPDYQDHVHSVVGDRRGVPDISMSAALSAAVDFWFTLPTPAGPAGGWALAGGTSEAAPLLAGIVAIADQAAGHRLGLLNDRLYEMARHDDGDGAIVDVTSGSNAVTLCLSGCETRTPVLLPVSGYTAQKGYDLASGLGTIDAAELVDALR
jgi:subtilase family serine protease